VSTIRKRSAGWEAQIRRRGYPTASRTLPTRAEAARWAAVVESEIARGMYVDRSILAGTTFGQLLQRYAAEVTVLKKGAYVESARIRAVLRESIAQVPLSELTSARLALWRDARLKAVSGSTVNRELNLLSHVVTVARKDWGYPVDNPLALVRRPRSNRGRSRRLSPSEEVRLMAELRPAQRGSDGRYQQGGVRNPWVYAAVRLALETALRRGELLSLRWEHVHLADAYLHLPDTKNGDSRDVPLSTRALDILGSLPRSPAGRVFPLSAESLKKAFERAVVRAGIADLCFHDLRHEATTRLAGKLDNVLELGAVTGHKTLSMLKRYYHPRATDLAKKLG
jgi:integrase